jgi:hypothetical protein
MIHLTVQPYPCMYGEMKTTIDLPDSLLYQAKVAAARRRTTLKDLVVEGLERVIQSPTASVVAPASAPADDAFFATDVYGVPVLKCRGVKVTNALIEKFREEEGV